MNDEQDYGRDQGNYNDDGRRDYDRRDDDRRDYDRRDSRDRDRRDSRDRDRRDSRDRDRDRRDRNRGKTACVGDCIRDPKAPMIGVEDILSPRFLTMLFAEVLGTFFLVFMGCGSVKLYAGQPALIAAPDPKGMVDKTDETNSTNDSSTTSTSAPIETQVYMMSFNAGQQAVMIAFAFGITVACIAQAIGHVSGAHLNPAVSFGLVISHNCSLLQAICYTIAQIIGAILASAFLRFLTWSSYNPMTLQTTDVEWNLAVSLPSVPPLQAFVIEIFLTFLLVLVVCGVCDAVRRDIKGSAPLAIGFTVFVCHVTGMQYSGSSINPARSIGPIVFYTKWQEAALAHIWIYIFGPLIGGLLAGLIYHVFFREKESNVPRRSVTPAPA